MNDKKEVVQLNLNDIIPNRFQPREVFDEKALKELAVSIKEHGVIQPIIVREVNGKYEIIAGERRYKASALAGMTKIPAIVRELDDKESSKVALLENLQRKNLNPIEEARTYQKILEIDQMTQEELAKTMGKSQSAVANKLRLLSLPDDIQEALLKEEISERHARTLLNVDDPKQQKELLKRVIADKMSVRKLEEEIKSIKVDGTELPSVNMFIDSNPLKPTAEIPQEVDNFGKVTLAPPEGEESPMGKFINYGELDKEEEKDEEDEDDSIPLLPPTSINPDKEREESSEIPKNNSSADLDNLLNLSSINGASSNNNYITEAEKIVKNDSSTPNEKIEDYFKTPDFGNFSLPQNSIIDSEEDDKERENTILPPSDIIDLPKSDASGANVKEGIEKVKDFIEELKSSGLPVTADEMDFESSYQVIIKIEKE